MPYNSFSPSQWKINSTHKYYLSKFSNLYGIVPFCFSLINMLAHWKFHMYNDQSFNKPVILFILNVTYVFANYPINCKMPLTSFRVKYISQIEGNYVIMYSYLYKNYPMDYFSNPPITLKTGENCFPSIDSIFSLFQEK